MWEIRDEIAMFIIKIAFKIMTTEALSDIESTLKVWNWHKDNNHRLSDEQVCEFARIVAKKYKKAECWTSDYVAEINYLREFKESI